MIQKTQNHAGFVKGVNRWSSTAPIHRPKDLDPSNGMEVLWRDCTAEVVDGNTFCEGEDIIRVEDGNCLQVAGSARQHQSQRHTC